MSPQSINKVAPNLAQEEISQNAAANMQLLSQRSTDLKISSTSPDAARITGGMAAPAGQSDLHQQQTAGPAASATISSAARNAYLASLQLPVPAEIQAMRSPTLATGLSLEKAGLQPRPANDLLKGLEG
jgi:hypothetical protein